VFAGYFTQGAMQMMRRVLAAAFAAVVLAGFGAGFGASPANADGERTTITPWRAEQTVARTVEGWNFPANTPVRLFVTDPASSPWWEISVDGMMTGPDGSIWFTILPSGFSVGDLQNGVWQLKVCAGPCQVLTMWIGGDAPMVPTGLPAKLCTPYITPLRNYPTFGPAGWETDPRSGYTFNDIVAYCGPYATPWTSWDTFLVPLNWQPGMVVPGWPYQTAFPWQAYWYGNVLYNNPYQTWCMYQVMC
jgi:hypothetical protein